MANKNFKVNESIKVVYQGKGVQSGLTVTMKVFDETDTEVVLVSPAGVLLERGSSGRYVGSFTPDAEGDWSIEISDSAGGEVVKHYSVGQFNIQDVGADVATTEAKVDDLAVEVDEVKSAVNNIQSPPMVG